MNNTISSVSYFGPIEVWLSLYSSTFNLIESQEHYQKKSFRNKCEIFGSAGVELLSVPLKKGKHHGQNIKEVHISYHENWTMTHIKKIKEAYIKSPYFLFYFDDICCILQKEHVHLYDLNMEIMLWLKTKLKLDFDFTFTESFQKEYQDALDLRNISHINKSKFQENYLSYPQVFEHKHGFQFNLSILDLLMNQGPESKFYLKEMNQRMTKSKLGVIT